MVATVMSNLGLHLFAKEHGMDLECTSVGDRNVLERMLEKGYAIGGEQSGHMIFGARTTGDGQLTRPPGARSRRRAGNGPLRCSGSASGIPRCSSTSRSPTTTGKRPLWPARPWPMPWLRRRRSWPGEGPGAGAPLGH